MRRARTAILLVGALIPAAVSAQEVRPPVLDCTLGFEGLRAEAHALTGAQAGEELGFEVVAISAPETWSAKIAFTSPGHPAHPAVTLRTLRKQATDVWTADSKGCGYGDQGQFVALMADMKSGDTEITIASRDRVERQKQEQSPLSPAP